MNTHDSPIQSFTAEDLASLHCGLDALCLPFGISVRASREHEVSLADAIDDDACTLYEEAGLVIDTTQNPAFFAEESMRWAEAARAGSLLFACAPGGEPLGFIALGLLDGEPWLQQLSVRRTWMRRGIGRALLSHAQRWSARRGALWLTTWSHVAYNRPFYESAGFVCVAEGASGPGMCGVLAEERRALPAPEQRVAMVYRAAVLALDP
jgi:GNAT superfamily N-acetyltransferase